MTQRVGESSSNVCSGILRASWGIIRSRISAVTTASSRRSAPSAHSRGRYSALSILARSFGLAYPRKTSIYLFSTCPEVPLNCRTTPPPASGSRYRPRRAPHPRRGRLQHLRLTDQAPAESSAGTRVPHARPVASRFPIDRPQKARYSQSCRWAALRRKCSRCRSVSGSFSCSTCATSTRAVALIAALLNRRPARSGRCRIKTDRQ